MDSRPKMTLGEALVGTSIAPLIKTRFLKKGRWVPIVSFKVEIAFWVFLKAAFIGRHYKDNTLAFIQTIGETGYESEVRETLKQQADTLPQDADTFQELWTRWFLNDVGFNSAVLLASKDKKTQRLGEALHQADLVAIMGVGYGYNYPELVGTLWAQSFDGDLAEQTRVAALEDFAVYVREAHPHLVSSLDLSESPETGSVNHRSTRQSSKIVRGVDTSPLFNSLQKLVEASLVPIAAMTLGEWTKLAGHQRDCITIAAAGMYMHWVARLLFERGGDEMRTVVGQAVVESLVAKITVMTSVSEGEAFDLIDADEHRYTNEISEALRHIEIPKPGIAVNAPVFASVLAENISACAGQGDEMDMMGLMTTIFIDPEWKQMVERVNGAALAFLAAAERTGK